MEIDREKTDLRNLLFEHGNIIVEAAPGTGKTFTGIYLAREAFRNRWVQGRQKTLILTFSRNARIQIEEELERFISSSELEKDEEKAIHISNYHSFYYAILQKKMAFWGLDKLRPATYEEEKQRDSRDKIIAGIKSNSPRYDDFPSMILQLLKNCQTLLTWLRNTFPFVILDEFQDSDNLQLEILNLWKPSHIAIFYDKFQMIYGFRNADINNVQKVIDLYNIPDQAKYSFSKIYRVDSQNSLCSYITDLRKDDLCGNHIASLAKGQWLRINACNLTAIPKLYVRCATRIRYISRFIDLSETTAIITRTNDLADSLQRSLSKKPTGTNKWYCSCRLLTGNGNVEEELRNNLLKLRSCRNDKDIRKWIGILFDNLLINSGDINFKDEFKKDKIEMLKGRRAPILKAMREEYQSIFDDVRKNNIKGIGKLLNFILQYSTEYVKNESTLDSDWYFYIKQFAKLSISFPDSKDWNEYCDTLENKLLVQSHFRKKQTSGITILNAHQSKGRQFDHVILPWLSENGESPTAARPGRKYDFNLEEDRRLLYVALTRAKKHVTIIYPQECPVEILRKWKFIT